MNTNAWNSQVDVAASKTLLQRILTMSKVLLREYYALCEGGVCQDLLTEDEKRFVKDGGMILSGKLQEADIQNGNGRIYPYRVLMREVKTYQKLVKENRALGELDHPDDSVINLEECISHGNCKIWMEDKNVMGKVKVLRYPLWQYPPGTCQQWSPTGYLLSWHGIREREHG